MYLVSHALYSYTSFWSLDHTSDYWEGRGIYFCLVLLCRITEGACAPNAGGPLVEVNQRGEILSYMSCGSSLFVVLLGVCVEYSHSTVIFSSDNLLSSSSTVILHSEDSPLWSVVAEFILLTGQRSLIWCVILLTRTECRLWCLITTCFPNVDLHLLCGVLHPNNVSYSIGCVFLAHGWKCNIHTFHLPLVSVDSICEGQCMWCIQ